MVPLDADFSTISAGMFLRRGGRCDPALRAEYGVPQGPSRVRSYSALDHPNDQKHIPKTPPYDTNLRNVSSVLDGFWSKHQLVQ